MLDKTAFFLLPRDAGEEKGGGLNPSAEFILSGVEGLRTGSA
jgi:hypothetical protein